MARFIFLRQTLSFIALACAVMASILCIEGCGPGTRDTDKITASPSQVDVEPARLRNVFTLHGMVDSLEYVELKYNGYLSKDSLKQIQVYNDTIYVLNGSRKPKLLAFSSKGEFLHEFQIPSSGPRQPQIGNFQIDDDNVSIYDSRLGIVYSFNHSGLLKARFDVGSQGSNFVSLGSGKFAFYKGIIDISKKEEWSALNVTDTSGKPLQFLLDFTETEKDMNVVPANPFSVSGQKAYFMSPFRNTLYEVRPDKLIPLKHFDFGYANPTDSVLSRLKLYQDYAFSSCVINMTDALITREHAFFAFTFEGYEGYLLINDKNQVLSCGTNSISTVDTDYNPIVPKGVYRDRFFSIVTGRDLLASAVHARKQGTVLKFRSRANGGTSKQSMAKAIFLMSYGIKNPSELTQKLIPN